MTQLVVLSLFTGTIAFSGTAAAANTTTPTLTTSGGAAEYAIGDGTTTVDPDLDVTDGTQSIDGARVIVDNPQAGDELSVDDSAGSPAANYGVTGSYDTSTDVLTLAGQATANEYEEILRTVAFRNTNSGPDRTTRDITFSLGTKLPYSGTNHYYEFVSDPGIAWDTAKSDAVSREYFGLSGYLVTVTSQAENDFVAGKLQGEGWIGATDRTSEGTWKWVTGPEAGDTFPPTGSPDQSYDNWNDGEPNDVGGEDRGHFLSDGLWNDLPNDSDIDGYVVEYGGSAGDPTITWRGTKQVDLVDTTDPTADASNSATSGDEDSAISFDGGASSDTETSIATYEWDWTSDGTYDDTGETLTHTYADPGTYTVELRVTDEGTNTDTDTLSVTVADVTDPVADASNSETAGDTGTAISFDGSESSDNGNIATYEWDWTDDGTYDDTGETASHTYAAPDTYTVRLRVTDGGGNTDTDTLSVTVSDATDPTADASQSVTSGDVGTAISFDGGASSDTETSIATYEWDWTSDGTYDDTGKTLTHAFADPGTYSVTLRVTDQNGNTDTDTLSVTVETGPVGWWTHRATVGRTGHAPDANGPGTPVENAWVFNFTDDENDADEYQGNAYATKNPAVVDGTVYFTSGNGKVYAVDATTGQKEWEVDTEGYFWSSPTVVDGTLYVGADSRYDSQTDASEGGYLYALDADTGAEQWRYDIDAGSTFDGTYGDYGAYGSFPVADGVVYFGDENGTVHAVDTQSGTAEWTYDAWRDDEYDDASFDHGPAVVAGTLYIKETDGQVYALDADTGAEEWTVDDGDRYGGWNGLAVGDGTVYTSGYDPDTSTYQLEAYDAETGTQEWTAETPGQYANLVGSPAFADGTVYVTTSTGNLSAYDGDTGSRLWTHDATPEGYSYARYDYGPVVADGTVYTNHYTWNYGGYVHAVDADTGTEQWSYNLSTRYLYTTPTVWNGYVYVGGQHYERTESAYTYEGRLEALGSTVTLSVTDTNSPVTETESLTVEASLTNTKSGSTTETVRLLDGGRELDSTTVSLASDETKTASLTWETVLGDDGDHELTVEVVDAARETTTVTVLDDRPPVARAGGNVTVGTGDEIGFDATNSTDRDGIVSYDWAFGDGTTGTGESVTHGFTADGNYTVTLTVTDTVGQTATDTIGVRVIDDSLLVADAGTNYTVDEEATLALDGTGSKASAGIATYAWDVGADGTTDATGATPTHTFADPGTYPVALTITDELGNTATTTTVVTVEDATDPVADAGPDRTVRERDTVRFDGTASTDNVGVTSYRWDFDSDDEFDASGPRPTYVYTEHGTFTLTLETTDEAGNVATDTAQVEVDEFVPPSVTVRIDRTDSPVVAGETLTVNVTARNVGDASATQTISLTGASGAVLDSQQVTLSSGESSRLALSWATTAGDSGRTSVSVRSEDDTATEQVSVQRQATFDVEVDGTDAPIDEGETLTVDATVTNVGDVAGTQTVELSAFDGTVVDSTTLTLDGGASQTVSLTWATSRGDAATKSVSVSTDDATASTLARIVELTPAKYTVAIESANASVSTNETLSVVANVTNVGDLSGSESVNLSIDGDRRANTTVALDGGDNSTVTFSVTPNATDVGTRTVTVDVTGSTDSTPVTVEDATNPVADAGLDRTATAGSILRFNASESTDNVGVTSYGWDVDGDETTDLTGPRPTHVFVDSGMYTVTLTTTDAAGNDDTDSVTVTVKTSADDSSSSGGSDADDGGSDAGDGDSGSEDGESDGDTPSEDSEGLRIDVRPADTNGTGPTTDESVSVTVENWRADRPVEIGLEPGGAGDETDGTDADDSTGNATGVRNVTVSNIRLNASRGGDFTLAVTTRDTGAPSSSLLDDFSTDHRDFALATGATPLGSVTVEHSIVDEDIDDVVFTFRIRKAYLDATAMNPDSVALYREEPTRQNRLSTELVGETDTAYVFEARSPGLSTFTVGSTEPLFEVTDARTSQRSLDTGDPVDVTVTVANHGGASGTFRAELLANDTVATTTAVEVPAGSERQVTVTHSFASAGTYALAVGAESAGEVSVGEPAADSGPTEDEQVETPSDETPSDGTPANEIATGTAASDAGGSNSLGILGLVALVVVLALVSAGVLVWRRRGEATEE